MENTIFVRNLTFFGIHGKEAVQRNQKREFHIEATVWIKSIEAAVKSDRLRDAFDYKHIIEAATAVIEGESKNLIESILTEIAERILAHPQAEKVKLTLWKRELLGSAESGITIVRSKSTL
ncbi:MAG TPA: dihydroneopterin aldolase [Candidatus Paceibacterota bacterium]|nr:dihydroneopterin aldolase [Candidatus Paceibacterota bacterium]